MTIAAIPKTRVPGPRGWPVVGALPSMAGDLLGFFRATAQRFGGVARLPMGPQIFLLVTDPDAVQHCLIDNNKNYPKNYESTARVFGNGLLSSNGDFWLRQRRLMQPAFHQREIARLSDAMVQEAQRAFGAWQDGASVRMLREMMDLTQVIFLRVMFSTAIGAKTAQMSASFDEVIRYFSANMFMPLPIEWPPARRRFEAAVSNVDQFIYGLITQRRATLDDAPNDLLTMLLKSADADTGEAMTDRQLRDEMFTLYFAGHETTATTLAWANYFMSQNPAVEARVRAEVRDVIGSRTPSVEDVPRLTYMRQVLDETLRMRPPAWMFTRIALNEDQVGGYPVAPGQVMMFSPYATHHLAEFWPDPDRFDPERFKPGAESGRAKGAYYPFSLGARMCIGNTFAMVEAALTLAVLFQNGRVELPPGTMAPPVPGVVMRPPAGLTYRFTRA